MREFLKHGGRVAARGSRAAGFTLIENMVALAVFAIGMMGIVYMMLNGVGLSRTSQSLTQAYVAAQEIIGMMRADQFGIYQYNNINTQNGAPSTSTVVGQNVSAWMQSLQYLPGSGATHGGYGQIAITPRGWGIGRGLSLRCARHDQLGRRPQELCCRDDGRLLGREARVLRSSR